MDKGKWDKFKHNFNKNITPGRAAIYVVLSTTLIIYLIVLQFISMEFIMEMVLPPPSERVDPDHIVFKTPSKEKINTAHIKNESWSSLLNDISKDVQAGCINNDQAYETFCIESDIQYAFSYTNDKIYLTTTFFNKIQSKNELVFVIAHEIAHNVNRDGLRNPTSRLINHIVAYFNLMNMLESAIWENELTADNFALHVLNCYYGHIGGSIDSIKNLANWKKRGTFSQNPPPRVRIKNILKYAKQIGFEFKKDRVPIHGNFGETCN